MSWTYNFLGQPATSTLPNGTTITYSHDRMGRLTQVSSDWVDAEHPAVLADNFSYHASGAVASVDWGNGTTTQRSFNDALQLKTLSFGLQASPTQYLNLEYDYEESVSNTGQIMSIVDHNDTTKTVDYSYDNFYRLKTADTQGTHWGLSWDYDRYGNRLSQTKTKGTAPTNTLSIDASTNRVNTWTYDAAGNVLNDGSHTYTYDANNMITTVDGGAYEYDYDAGAQRVMKTSATETRYYVMGVGEYSSVSGWVRVFIKVAGTKIEYAYGTTRFYQSDHLGTPRVETNMAGAIVGTWSAYPFGEEWESSGASGDQHRFTGHLRDAETSMEYAGARFYASGNGRWGAADPVLGDTSDPQRLNRYGYVLGDPVSYRDPDGRNHHNIVELPEGRFVLEEPIRVEVNHFIFPPWLEGGTSQWVWGERFPPSPIGEFGSEQGTRRENAERTIELHNIVKDARTSALELARGKCATFIDAVLAALGRGSRQDLMVALQGAHILLRGWNSRRPALDQDTGEMTTIGEFLRSHPGTLAVTHGRTIFLNRAFYDLNPTEQAEGILHEAFHLEGVGGLDSELVWAVNQAFNTNYRPRSQEEASAFFQHELETRCR